MKYRWKETVEAFRYDGDLMNSMGEFYVPEWAVQAYNKGVLFYKEGTLYLKTSGEVLKVSVGDYVVEEKGIVYMWEAFDFERMYEPVKEGEA